MNGDKTDHDAPRESVDLRVETISEVAFLALACAQRGLVLRMSVRREDGAPLRPSEALEAINATDGVKARMLDALAPTTPGSAPGATSIAGRFFVFRQVGARRIDYAFVEDGLDAETAQAAYHRKP